MAVDEGGHPAVRLATGGPVEVEVVGPDEDDFYRCLRDVESGRAEFAIASRLSDTSGQTYAQTVPYVPPLTPGERRDPSFRPFIVEHRDGSADEHYEIIVGDHAQAAVVLMAWAIDDPAWRTLPWQPMNVDAHH